MPGLSRSSSTRTIHDPTPPTSHGGGLAATPEDPDSPSQSGSGRQLSDSPRSIDRKLSVTTRLLRSKNALLRAQQNIESIESLVVNAAVISALLVSFVVANMIGNFKEGDCDACCVWLQFG